MARDFEDTPSIFFMAGLSLFLLGGVASILLAMLHADDRYIITTVGWFLSGLSIMFVMMLG
jgi:hypothetical protein